MDNPRSFRGFSVCRGQGAVVACLVALAMPLLMACQPRVVVVTRPEPTPFTPAPAFREIQLVDDGEGRPRGQTLDEGGVYLAPLAGFPVDLLDRLQSSMRKTWGIKPTLLDEVTVEKAAKPEGNTQLDAFNLLDQILRAYPVSTDPTVVMGFITQDVRAYNTGDFWNFGATNPAGYAVVSTARMDPLSFGEPANQALLMKRLRKMTTRYVGLVLYRLPYSDDSRSVLYRPIRSQADLDRMTEWPCPERPRKWIACDEDAGGVPKSPTGE